MRHFIDQHVTSTKVDHEKKTNIPLCPQDQGHVSQSYYHAKESPHFCCQVIKRWQTIIHSYHIKKISSKTMRQQDVTLNTIHTKINSHTWGQTSTHTHTLIFKFSLDICFNLTPITDNHAGGTWQPPSQVKHCFPGPEQHVITTPER